MKDLLDVQSLHPAGVSTNLNNFKKVGGDVVTADACARGSLCDLGTNVMNVFGAVEHTCTGRAVPLVAWSPDVNKLIAKQTSKDKNVVA